MSELLIPEDLIASDLETLKTGTADLISKVQAVVDTLPKDASTEDDRATLRSAAAKIAKIKNRADEVGKAMTDEWQRNIKAVGVVRNSTWDALEGLQKTARGPLTDYENYEKARVEHQKACLNRLNTIIQGLPGQPTQEEIQAIMTEIEPLAPPYDWEEFQAEGFNAYAAARQSLVDALAVRIKYDEDQKELIALREKNAARDKEDADKKAAADKEADDKRIADAAAEKERQRLQKIEDDKKAEEDRRAKDRKHKGAIHKAIVDKLVSEAKITPEQAKGVVTLIAQGVVPNIKILY